MPTFLRFNEVEVNFTEPVYCKPLCIAERCELFIPLWRHFAPAFQHCSLVFQSGIGQSADCDYNFPDHMSHLAYIRDGLIPQHLDQCSSYSFVTSTNKNGSNIDIAGLLAVDAIKRCSRIQIKLCQNRLTSFSQHRRTNS